MSNLTKTQATANMALQNSIKKMEDEIKRALPKHMDVGRFSRVVMTAVTRSPKLLECSQTSFFGSLLQAAQLGLEPNDPSQKCFLIPYGSECTLQLGARGLVELVRRSGELTDLYAEVVYEKEMNDFRIELGLNRTIVHKPMLFGERGKPVLVYAVAKLSSSEVPTFSYMTVDEIDKARYTGKSGDSPAWKNWWSEMAKKVVIKRLCKYLPLSPEIQRAIGSDETIKRNFVEDMTEPQEGETMEEIEVDDTATPMEKADFYKWLGDEGLTSYLEVKEKTEINGHITKFRLDQLRDLAVVRAKDDEKEAEVVPPEDKTEKLNGGVDLSQETM